MNKTPIEWTTFSANPLKFRAPDGRIVWACEKLSPGCKHCYAEDLSHRYGGVRRAGEWNAATMATLTPFLDEAELQKMLTAKTVGGVPVSGSRVFVGDMTDIFGEWVPDALLDRLFAVFALRPDVTWQVLTKRAARMRTYVNAEFRSNRVITEMQALTPNSRVWVWPSWKEAMQNVWLGVSVEDQPRADERIPLLLQTPAAVRFISAEPLLGRIDLRQAHRTKVALPNWPLPTRVDWVIVGCESGKTPRNHESYEAHARALLAQCAAAGVAGFHKQMPIKGRVSGDVERFPADLRVREFPRAAVHA